MTFNEPIKSIGDVIREEAARELAEDPARQPLSPRRLARLSHLGKTKTKRRAENVAAARSRRRNR